MRPADANSAVAGRGLGAHCAQDSSPGVPERRSRTCLSGFIGSMARAIRATGGSGLGLAISQGIVSAHGGTMSAQHSDQVAYRSLSITATGRNTGGGKSGEKI